MEIEIGGHICLFQVNKYSSPQQLAISYLINVVINYMYTFLLSDNSA
jgi:hypothetical protein